MEWLQIVGGFGSLLLVIFAYKLDLHKLAARLRRGRKHYLYEEGRK